MAAGTPPRYEALWVNDLLRELPWRVCASRPVGGDAHINIRELRSALRHGLAEVGSRRSLKLLMVLDSRVAGGAMGKGRSAARLLNAELRAVLPEILGRDVYLGFLFGPSRLNPGDPPSRLRDLPHGGGGLPAWARDILRDDFDAFDFLAAQPRQSASTAGWAALVVKAAALGILRLSPKELPFDSTLGYPGEGPGAPRPDVDLRRHRALTPVVAARRDARRRELFVHAQLFYGLDAASLLRLPAGELDAVLAELGQLMYRGGRSLGDFAETINAVVDCDRGLRGHLPRPGMWPGSGGP